MPQMSPLMWLILYIYFMLLLLLFNIMIYYLKFMIEKFKQKNNLNMKFNLKWFW